jgi:hypothetical protein
MDPTYKSLLKYILRVEMSGFGPPTRISVKIDPTLQRIVQSGHILNYTLLSGHVYDLSTLRLHVIAEHEPCPDNPPSPVPAGYIPNPISTIPSPVECLIDTLNVSLGSTQLNQINNYGQLFAALSRYTTKTKDFGRRMMTSAASSFMQQPRPANRRDGGQMRFIISSWLGFLGSATLLDTTLRGPLQIEMVLSDEKVTGTPFIYHTYLTIDELPGMTGMGDLEVIQFADYRSSITYNHAQAPFGVLQTDNYEDHRLQTVFATLLETNYNIPKHAVRPIQDLGFTYGFKHTSKNIATYHFEYDGHRYTHNIEYWETLDRLKEAMGDSLELPLLLARGNDMQLDELCDNIFLAGESTEGKGIPDGTLEVLFKTQCQGVKNDDPDESVADCYVFMFARYSCYV